MSSDPAEELQDAPQPGSVFAGKYRIDSLLGAGGMGFVLAATHLRLDEKVAIKMLLPKLGNEPETVARFLREGRAAVKIRSEHVCRIFDVGSDNGSHYIIMEHLEGCDLADLLARETRLRPDVAIDYVLQACEAIAEAHALRIVHRDVKPANLFLVHGADGAPCIKVLDFGISKMTAPDDLQLSMTKSAVLMGSPLYMSPEQLRSAKNVDQRADIWALGVVLYELVSGRRPFAAETLPELGALVFSGNVPDLRAAAPDAPAELAAVVATCLRSDVDARYPSVAELAEALAPLGSHAARASAARIARVLAGAPRPPWSLPPPSAASASTTLALAKTEPLARRSRAPVLVAIVGALAVLGGGVAFAFHLAGAHGSAVATSALARSSAAPPVDATASVPTASAPPATSSEPSPPRAGAPRSTATARHAAHVPSARAAPPAASTSRAASPPPSATSDFAQRRFD